MPATSQKTKNVVLSRATIPRISVTVKTPGRSGIPDTIASKLNVGYVNEFLKSGEMNAMQSSHVAAYCLLQRAVVGLNLLAADLWCGAVHDE